MLGVRRLVIDRHPSLNGEWRRGIDSRGRAGRIRQSAPVDTQVGQESLAQADVQLGVAEFQAVVKEHTVAGADRSAPVSERIPCNADAWSNGAVELLPDLAAERRLGAGKSVEGRRISKNQSVQWVVAGIASAAVRNAVDQLYVHGARRSNAWRFGRVIKRCVKINQPACAVRTAGIRWLTEEGVANAVGQGNIFPDPPGILTVVLKLVVKDIGRYIQRGLRK